MIDLKKTFTFTLTYVFKLWGGFLIFVVLMLDFLLKIDSYIRYMFFPEILLNVATMIILFILLAMFITLLWGIIIIFLKKIFNEHKITLLVIELNNLFIFFFGFYLLLSMLRFYLGRFIFINLHSLKIELGLITFCLILLIYYFFKKNIFEYFSKTIEKIFKYLLFLFFFSAIYTLFYVSVVILSENNETIIQNNKKIIKKYNIIFITFDALRAEEISLYGYYRKTTPNIDKFAKTSYVFENAFAACSFTSPSVITLLTGKYPVNHKVYSLSGFLRGKNKEENLAKILQSYGYATAAIVGNRAGHPIYTGLYDSFNFLPLPTGKKIGDVFYIDLLQQFLAPFNIILARQLMDLLAYFHRLKFFIPFKKNIFFIDNPANTTFQLAETYLKNVRQPFFLWVHIYPPHDPYLPSKYFPGNFIKDKSLNNLDTQSKYLGLIYPKKLQSKINNLKDYYDEAVLEIDKEFKNFIDTLEKLNIRKDSIIVVSADHGESFEKGLQGHYSPYLYNSVIHIPLIIYFPNKKGHLFIRGNVSNVDIAKTILDYINIPLPKWMEGESFKKYLDKNMQTSIPKFSMNLQTNFISKPISRGTMSVIKDNYKLIYNLTNNTENLYDIYKDKNETNNLINKNPKIVNSLKKLILQKIAN